MSSHGLYKQIQNHLAKDKFMEIWDSKKKKKFSDVSVDNKLKFG